MDRLKKIAQISGDFKLLKRAGWILHHATQEESVADHTWGLLFLVMIYTPPYLNKQKCLELAVIHDLAEVEAGDITPFDGITPAQKEHKEMIAMKNIAAHLNEDTFLTLFKELEEQKTPEAQFVKQLDKIEVMLQAYYFINHGYMQPIVYEEYYKTSKSRIHLPYLIDLFNQLIPNYKDIEINKSSV